MKRIYICGPMRGQPENNVPAFNRAAERFRALGWFVRNPVEISEEVEYACRENGKAATGSDFLREDVRVLSRCDAIALLPDWETSVGARCEVASAITFGMDFYDAGTATRIERPRRVVISGGYDVPPGRIDSLDAIREESIAWANTTFTTAHPGSKAAHLEREAKELRANPHDVEEMADVFLLLAHLSDGHDLIAACRTKLEKNKRRTWGKPDADGVVEHVSEGAA